MTPTSRSSEYALRAMTFLGQQPTGEFRLVREIADPLEIPVSYLGKILVALVRVGILESRPGKRGGYRLNRHPADISLFQIVRSQENIEEKRRCILGQKACDDENPCPLHDFWSALYDAFVAKLNETTLQDMLDTCNSVDEIAYPMPDAE